MTLIMADIRNHRSPRLTSQREWGGGQIVSRKMAPLGMKDVVRKLVETYIYDGDNVPPREHKGLKRSAQQMGGLVNSSCQQCGPRWAPVKHHSCVRRAGWC